ncbi:DUF397 domain-containing protein [Streptomyces sp. E11-3]|uniref:DUF397 domain-containing protein n=1 Tax=Streptomyces sp. E11-3 TaxID=3110112 RepID=UPI0039801E04
MRRTPVPVAALTETVSDEWRKSSHSGPNGCIEYTELSARQRAIRDTKKRELGMIVFDSTSWRAFISGINTGVLRP